MLTTQWFDQNIINIGTEPTPKTLLNDTKHYIESKTKAMRAEKTIMKHHDRHRKEFWIVAAYATVLKRNGITTEERATGSQMLKLITKSRGSFT